jgi:two-component system sensor histidine kinase VanS
MPAITVPRPTGPSVRLTLTLSYTGFLLLAGALLLGAVWLFLLRYVPAGPISTEFGFAPNRSDLLRAFAPAAAAVLVFLLVLGLAGGWLLAGRILSPLTRITATTRQVAAGSRNERIRLPGPQDEFRELADAFDTMLDRLEAHAAEQQRFAANASHELRTPLAITQTLLDVARADQAGATADLVERLRQVNTRAIDLTESLLLLSAADQGASLREPVDLSLALEEAAETLLPLAEQRGITLELSAEPATALGSPALLTQLATNLLHNAIVHNLPSGGRIRLTTAPGAGTAVLVVENTGPVILEATAATLTEPFQRGAARTRDSETDSGVGLGLAIVAAVVRAHHGTLTLTPYPEGGLRVTVELPKAAVL